MSSNTEEFKKQIFILLKESVLERLKILPGISSLAATLLVVATFNSNLLPINVFVKILLSVLLFLIPFSLFFYLYELNETSNEALKTLEKKIGQKFEHPQKNVITRFTVYYPWIALLILFLVNTGIIVLIWI